VETGFRKKTKTGMQPGNAKKAATLWLAVVPDKSYLCRQPANESPRPEQ